MGTRTLTRWYVSHRAPTTFLPRRAFVIVHGTEWKRDGWANRMYRVSEQRTLALPPGKSLTDDELVAEVLALSTNCWKITSHNIRKAMRGAPRLVATEDLLADDEDGIGEDAQERAPISAAAPRRASSSLTQAAMASTRQLFTPVAVAGAPDMEQTATYYPYATWEVALIVAGSALGFALSSFDVGPVFFLAAIVYAFFRDAAGAASMRGTIHWNRVHGQARVWAIIGFVCIYPLAFLFYDLRIIQDALAARRDAPETRKRQIAELEARLGILPATEGTCRACGNPLQVGAEFCQSCGVPVVERPKVCPSCATMALPDAAFCPKCGAAFA